MPEFPHVSHCRLNVKPQSRMQADETGVAHQGVWLVVVSWSKWQFWKLSKWDGKLLVNQTTGHSKLPGTQTVKQLFTSQESQFIDLIWIPVYFYSKNKNQPNLCSCTYSIYCCCGSGSCQVCTKGEKMSKQFNLRFVSDQFTISVSVFSLLPKEKACSFSLPHVWWKNNTTKNCLNSRKYWESN